ncbi:MAG: alpha-amylase, partial [Propionibacteriaceae bacterium]|nr:alpha-amylase [Propionibacteriaceae bacterium]
MNARWAKTAIWWSVYPLGACGAPIRTGDRPGPHHRLRLLEGWLDHIIALGCNGLALGPIWQSSSHGYDIIDHLMIDPRLGDEADFDRLIDHCHRRGIRVLLDGVFNHVSSQHAGVKQVQSQGWGCAAARLFRRDPNQADGLSRFEGHDSLVELDHSHPEVVDQVTRIMSYWLDRGADGWRLDAAYRVPTG